MKLCSTGLTVKSKEGEDDSELDDDPFADIELED